MPYRTILNLIAAFFLSLSNGSAFAEEDSVGPVASEQAEGSATGLQRIEDGSVVSNEHTVKWRIFTDNGREFFLKASNKLSLAWFQITLEIYEVSEKTNLFIGCTFSFSEIVLHMNNAEVKLSNTTLGFLYSSGFLNLGCACLVLETRGISLQFHH